jgi:hypothetical protein
MHISDSVDLEERLEYKKENIKKSPNHPKAAVSLSQTPLH